MYHQVSPQPSPKFQRYTITPRAFAGQMKWLALAGYRTITLDDLCAARAQQMPLPKRAAIITFDDGYEESVSYAVPLMARHGFTAIFYLVASLVGQPSKWLLPELGCEFPLIDWNAARHLEKAGFHCGAHSLSHPHLADVSSATCRQELKQSRQILEDELGHEVRHLAYPYGSYNDNVRQLAAEAGYISACSTRKGLSGAEDDMLALHRVSIYGHDSLIDFALRLRYPQRNPRQWLRSKRNSVKQWFGSTRKEDE
jgi:peptidoglycan/xylan/chitin deacetylase (PgdA/CDA1 family)